MCGNLFTKEKYRFFNKFDFYIENFQFFYYLYGDVISEEVIVWNMVMQEHLQIQISRT